MMDAVLSAMGNWAILPAVLLALAGYLISLLIGLHGTKSQARTKFLELWPTAVKQDDMVLEVTVRHGFGTYIPASVIRSACRLDHCADRILLLAQLWSLLQHRRPEGRLQWIKPSYSDPKYLARAERVFTALYFVIALAAFASFSVAIDLGHKSTLAWICGVNALLFLTVAFGMLGKAEMFSVARKQGKRLLEDVNLEPGVAASAEAQSPTAGAVGRLHPLDYQGMPADCHAGRLLARNQSADHSSPRG